MIASTGMKCEACSLWPCWKGSHLPTLLSWRHPPHRTCFLIPHLPHATLERTWGETNTTLLKLSLLLFSLPWTEITGQPLLLLFSAQRYRVRISVFLPQSHYSHHRGHFWAGILGTTSVQQERHEQREVSWSSPSTSGQQLQHVLVGSSTTCHHCAFSQMN